MIPTAKKVYFLQQALLSFSFWKFHQWKLNNDSSVHSCNIKYHEKLKCFLTNKERCTEKCKERCKERCTSLQLKDV